MASRDPELALSTFRQHGGVLRTKQALALGIHPAALYQLRNDGRLAELARGLYRVADEPEASHPDLAVVAARAPNTVVCLISALAFHDLTTQVPAVVHLAVPRGNYHRVNLTPLPVQVYQFDANTFAAGREIHELSGTRIKVYGAARSVVDVFKFRHKIGLDVALEALRLARSRNRVAIKELLHFARLLRVERPMRPYLEALA